MWRTVKASLKGRIADLEIHPDKISWNSNEIVIPISSIATLHEGTSLPDKILLKITPKPDTGLDPAGFLFNFSSEGQTVRNEVKEFIVTRIATSVEPSIAPPSHSAQEFPFTTTLEKKQQNPPSAASTISKQELACRVNLLSCNPQLARLHRSLVRQGGLKEEEFWSQRSSLLKETAWRLEQTRGIPAILPESIATHAEPGKKNLTLTPQAIQAIFAQFPAVQKAYIQNVPLKQTEREFWSQFFTSRNLLYEAKNVDDFIGQFNEQSKNILQAQLGPPTTRLTTTGNENEDTLKNALQCGADKRPIVKEIKNSLSFKTISQISSFPFEENEEGIGVDNWNNFMEVYFTGHSQVGGLREKVKALSVGEANFAALAFEFQRHIWSGSARKVELAEKLPQIPLLARSIERAKQISTS